MEKIQKPWQFSLPVFASCDIVQFTREAARIHFTRRKGKAKSIRFFAGDKPKNSDNKIVSYMGADEQLPHHSEKISATRES